MSHSKQSRRNLFIICILLCCACSHREEVERPHHPDQACAVVNHDPTWTQSLLKAQRDWGAPIELILAVIRHESSYRAHARPHHRRKLKLFSRSRKSSAYGYAQVIDATWRWYQSKTHNPDHRRDDFSHAVNFVGWYLHLTHVKHHVPYDDYNSHYLAYHEGHRGFGEKTYASKQRLIDYAHEVAQTAQRYHDQLKRCPITP